MNVIKKDFFINKFCKIFRTIEFKSLSNLLPFLLISLLLYNSFGYIFVHIYHVALVKSEVLKSIEDYFYEDQQTILVFSKNDLAAVRAGIERIDEKEFRYKGGMYDIVNKEIKNDSVYFYCVFDEKEIFLISLFTEQFKENQGEDSSDKILSHFFFNVLSYYQLLNDWIVPPDKFSIIDFLNRSDNQTVNYFPDIPTPPPQILIFT